MTGLVAPEMFELEIRETCDRMYERPSPPGNPVMRLLDGSLSRDEAIAFWGGHWTNSLIFNQITLPRLIEKCPEVDARVAMWGAIYPEYGKGHMHRAHPVLNRNFLIALGIPEEKLPWELDRKDPEVRQRIERIDSASWLSLLTWGFLGIETVGPKVFPLVEPALAKTFKLKKEDLRFFSVHASEDQKDSEILFPIVARYAIDAKKQQEVREGLAAFFEQERYRQYCCALGPMTYTFVPAWMRPAQRLERRSHPRYRPRLGALLAGPGEQRAVRVEDVSIGGALLRTESSYQVGSSLIVTLFDPASVQEVSIAASVARVSRDTQGRPRGVGVQFLFGDIAQTRRIGEFLEKALSATGTADPALEALAKPAGKSGSKPALGGPALQLLSALDGRGTVLQALSRSGLPFPEAWQALAELKKAGRAAFGGDPGEPAKLSDAEKSERTAFARSKASELLERSRRTDETSTAVRLARLAMTLDPSETSIEGWIAELSHKLQRDDARHRR